MTLLTRMFAPKGPKWLNPIQRRIPYPLRSFGFAISFNPFGFWWPEYRNFNLSEKNKAAGGCICYVRFAWFEISRFRWV